MRRQEDTVMDEARRTRRSAAPEPDPLVSRRAVTQGVLSGGLVAALLATDGRRGARAQATPTAAGDADETGEMGPRRYVLDGGETELVFVPGRAGGPAQLDYRDATGPRRFAGDELDVAPCPPLGRLASVLVEAVPDGFTRYLTLLVPEVNRDEDRLEVPVRTLAILTTQLTSIGGPALVEGALQTYEVVALAGVAEFAPA
jgi:hypothetical protein